MCISDCVQKDYVRLLMKLSIWNITINFQLSSALRVVMLAAKISSCKQSLLVAPSILLV